jgi:O6-methylguanine-DNA--protein-cysteine methyltransferase
VTSQTPESASRKDKHRKRAGSQSVQDPPEEAVDAAKEIVDKAESQKTFQDVEAVQESTAPVISTSSKAPEARPIKTVRDEKCPFETTLAQATRRIPFGESASTQLVVSRKNAQIGTIPVAVECGLLTELDELYMVRAANLLSSLTVELATN